MEDLKKMVLKGDIFTQLCFMKSDINSWVDNDINLKNLLEGLDARLRLVKRYYNKLEGY